ncbi:hypothetical protein [Streptomyces albiflavescens]|uniref:hypothetical protein n=1 Tax=Streptomyces albiflavescens TaxID=1623582 RepID=UPI00166B4F30|nr:hypothetical protein [Streptomyces albiflavescens]
MDPFHGTALAADQERGHRGHFGEHPSWEDPEAPGHTHDPHEVTVQLDGVGRQLEDWLVQQAKDAPGAQDGSDGPVFVDASGRRSRRFRRLGILVGIACAVYAVVIVATLVSGNSNAPWLPVPGQQDDPPAGQVDTSPLPAESVSPSGTGSASPGASATASDGTTPSPGASPTPDASGTAADPGTSSDPKPSSSATTKPNPGTSTTKDPDPGATDPVVDPPTPTATDTGTATADPTESAVIDGSGSGTVADGAASPLEQSHLEHEQSGTGSSYSSSYPENVL